MMRKYSVVFYYLMLSGMLFLDSVGATPTHVALVIGNGRYPKQNQENLFGPLFNPANDAQDIAEILRSYSFEVEILKNATFQQMEHAINQFAKKLGPNGVGLFYYSGHGIQWERQNYLIPVGHKFHDPTDLKYQAVNVNWIVEKMEQAETRVNIIILDACRDHFKLAKGAALPKGFAEMKAAEGVIISYATRPGEVALELSSDRNSVYTKHLLAAMETNEGIAIEKVFKEARTAVVEVTKDTPYPQIPWTESGLTGEDFCFGDCGDQSSREIAQLLRACETHFQANRLTSGVGGTALECYEEVLRKDPANTKALAGLKNIEAWYVEWTQAAVDNGDSDKAREYLVRLRLVNSESKYLPRLEAQVLARSQPEPTPAPLPDTDTTAVLSAPAGERFMVSQGEAQKVFGLDKNWRPQMYIERDFEDRGAVVIDHLSGLIWQKSGSTERVPYEEAQAYIQKLNSERFGGYSDWRLPTVQELLALMVPEAQASNIYIHPLFDTRQNWCWSANTRSSNSAWVVYFYLGLVDWNPVDYKLDVRAVRP